MALVLESARGVSWRWDLKPGDFNRVADFTSVVFILVVVYLFTSRSIHAIYVILEWLPILLFLLLVTQLYSTRGKIALSALFISLRRQADRLLDQEMDLSYPYFMVCLLSASVGNIGTPGFFPGLCLLTAWALWPYRPTRYPIRLWMLLITISFGLGSSIQGGFRQLHGVVEERVMAWLSEMMWSNRDPHRTRTAIGSIERLKLSDRIRVRIEGDDPLPMPFLLREASYDTFNLGSWSTKETEFEALDPSENAHNWRLAPAKKDAKAVAISTYLNKEQGIVPTPHGTFQIFDKNILSLEKNPYGAIMLEMPPGHVHYQVSFDPGVASASPPTDNDQQVPKVYQKVMDRIVDKLGLQSATSIESIDTLEQFFAQNFHYSLVQPKRYFRFRPMRDFLLKDRQGHCEYFATATVLLLRAAGIPARYEVGYSVQEYSELENRYIARARHAHSWASAYVDGRWTVVDTTPAVWAELEEEAASSWQLVSDLWSWMRYALSVAFSGNLDEEGSEWYAWLLVPLFLLLIWRLRNRKRVRHGNDTFARDDCLKLPGRDSEIYRIIERLEAEGYAVRPGETLSAWLDRIEPLAGKHNTLITMIRSLLNIHYRYRFDPQGIEPAERAFLRRRSSEIFGPTSSI